MCARRPRRLSTWCWKHGLDAFGLFTRGPLPSNYDVPGRRRQCPVHVLTPCRSIGIAGRGWPFTWLDGEACTVAIFDVRFTSIGGPTADR